jgi:hypothetical protein
MSDYDNDEEYKRNIIIQESSLVDKEEESEASVFVDDTVITTTTITTESLVNFDEQQQLPVPNDIITEKKSSKRKRHDYSTMINIGIQKLDQCPKNLYTKVLSESIQKIKDCMNFPLWLSSGLQADAIYRNRALGWMPMFAKNKPTLKNQKAGANEYIITGYENMWRTINNTAPHLRNYFELLPPMFTCHLYIDVEIYRASNQHRSREDIENTIHEKAMKEIVILMKEYKWITSSKQVEFLVSESSNEKKVSLHFHVIVAGKRFYNNFHCGAFIRQFTVAMQRKYGKDPKTNPFFFRMKEDKIKNLKLVDENEMYEFWADATVYTGYRVFRMWLNSKANDYRPLFPIDIHQRNRNTSNTNPPTTMDKALWFKSLLSCMTVEEAMNPHFALMTCCDPDGSIPTSHSNTRSYRLDIDYQKKRRKDPVKNKGEGMDLNSLDQMLNATTKKSKFVFTNVERYNKNGLLVNRIPALIFKQWNTFDVSITRVQYVGYDEKTKIAYYNTDSRYCTMINGEHKSNHVKFQVHLERCAFYQTCFDDGSKCSYDGVKKTKMSREFDLCLLDSSIQLTIFQFLKNDASNIQLVQSNASLISQYITYQIRVPPYDDNNNTKRTPVEWITFLNS